jgi:hypothetical protein
MLGRNEYEILIENMKRKYLRLNGRAIVKQILKVWTGFFCLKTGTDGGTLVNIVTYFDSQQKQGS